MNAEPTPTIGHNAPPPFDTAAQTINDLYDEAKNWLDGEEVDRQEYADDISDILNQLRTARKEADKARKVENAPFDEGKAEVQGRYNPLLKKADSGVDACKAALAPWLKKLDDEKEAAAEKARLEAEEAQRVAEEAMQVAAPDNLEERAAAEEKGDEAKQAKIRYHVAAKDTATASGGAGRAVGLRSLFRPVLTDGVAAARHYWATRRPEMEAFLLICAKSDVGAGKRAIPGFDMIEDKSVV